MAEAVADFLVIIPGRAVHALALGGLGGVALVGQGVEVACLVILIALVDPLQLHQIPAGAQTVVVGRLDVVGVVKDIDAVVLRGGRERGVDRPGVGQVAGGQHRAAQQLGDAVGAVAAGVADPEDGVHRLVLLELLDLHGGAGVEQHDDFSEALLLDPVDQVALVVGQGQDVAGGGIRELRRLTQAVCSGIEAGRFARVAAEDDDGRVLVISKQGGVQLADRHLADLGALVLIGADDVAAGGLGGSVGRFPVLIELYHCGIHFEALSGQRLAQRDSLRRLDQLAHGAAELHLAAAAHTEQRDLAAVDGGLALQSHAALGRDPGRVGDLRADQIAGIGEIRLITIVGGIEAALDTGFGCAQKLVHLAGPCRSYRRSDGEQDGNGKEDASQATVQPCFLHFTTPFLP